MNQEQVTDLVPWVILSMITCGTVPDKIEKARFFFFFKTHLEVWLQSGMEVPQCPEVAALSPLPSTSPSFLAAGRDLGEKHGEGICSCLSVDFRQATVHLMLLFCWSDPGPGQQGTMQSWLTHVRGSQEYFEKGESERLDMVALSLSILEAEAGRSSLGQSQPALCNEF